MTGEVFGDIIKNSMADKINSYFESPTMYKEQIVQGLRKPSFFIWQTNLGQTKRMGRTFDRLYQMNVRYHPQDDLPNEYEHLCDVQNKLLECLSIIDVPMLTSDNNGGYIAKQLPVIGTQMDSSISDGVLQVFVSYKITVKQVTVQTPQMNELNINKI